MKKVMIICLTTFLIGLLIPCGVLAEEMAFSQNICVQFSSGSREVKAVWVDMKNPLYRAEVVLAKNQVGKVDTLQNIALQLADNETDVVAAINGTFFNAYSDLQPVGTIQLRGRSAFITNSGTSIGFAVDNQIEIVHLYTSVTGSINGNWEYPYNWGVWGINQVYGRDDANILYTPDFGNQVDAGGKTAIVIRNKKVTEIKKGLAPIYVDGYTLVFGAEVYSSMFKVGDYVDYRIQYNQIDYQNGIKKGIPLEWSDIRTTLGAGPMLLQNGKIVLDAKMEGFTDSKFMGQAQRSFIGENSEQVLVFGTVCDVTLHELAEIMLNMGLESGMNLDGGASSSLYFKGQIITEPGRKLSNAIVITKKKTRPIRLQLNGRELFLDTDPYFENNTTMVPMRGIMEALGAEAGWDSATGTLWAQKGDIRVEFWNGSDIVRVNKKEGKLLAPVRVVNNRTHVPARFMTEVFGGDVNFDADQNMVVMTMEITDSTEFFDNAVRAYENGNRAEAIEMFLELLMVNPEHTGALLKLAQHFASEADHENTKTWFEKYVAIQTTDYDVWNSLAWTYANLGDIPKAMEVFLMLTRERPQAAAYWSALGDMYAHYQIQDRVNAKKCYEKALSCKPSEKQKLSLEAKLKKLG